MCSIPGRRDIRSGTCCAWLLPPSPSAALSRCLHPSGLAGLFVGWLAACPRTKPTAHPLPSPRRACNICRPCCYGGSSTRHLSSRERPLRALLGRTRVVARFRASFLPRCDVRRDIPRYSAMLQTWRVFETIESSYASVPTL